MVSGESAPMTRRALLLASLAVLAGCATALPPPPSIVAPAGSALAELEPLYAARAGRQALTISVASNGCTRKEDFAFFLERKGQALTLAFGRTRIDTCQSFAQGKVDLPFTWEELGVAERAPLFLLNPMSAWTGPGEL